MDWLFSSYQLDFNSQAHAHSQIYMLCVCIVIDRGSPLMRYTNTIYINCFILRMCTCKGTANVSAPISPKLPAGLRAHEGSCVQFAIHIRKYKLAISNRLCHGTHVCVCVYVCNCVKGATIPPHPSSSPPSWTSNKCSHSLFSSLPSPHRSFSSIPSSSSSSFLAKPHQVYRTHILTVCPHLSTLQLFLSFFLSS